MRNHNKLTLYAIIKKQYLTQFYLVGQICCLLVSFDNLQTHNFFLCYHPILDNNFGARTTESDVIMTLFKDTFDNFGKFKHKKRVTLKLFIL